MYEEASTAGGRASLGGTTGEPFLCPCRPCLGGTRRMMHSVPLWLKLPGVSSLHTPWIASIYSAGLVVGRARQYQGSKRGLCVCVRVRTQAPPSQAWARTRSGAVMPPAPLSDGHPSAAERRTRWGLPVIVVQRQDNWWRPLYWYRHCC